MHVCMHAACCCANDAAGSAGAGRVRMAAGDAAACQMKRHGFAACGQHSAAWNAAQHVHRHGSAAVQPAGAAAWRCSARSSVPVGGRRRRRLPRPNRMQPCRPQSPPHFLTCCAASHAMLIAVHHGGGRPHQPRLYRDSGGAQRRPRAVPQKAGAAGAGGWLAILVGWVCHQDMAVKGCLKAGCGFPAERSQSLNVVGAAGKRRASVPAGGQLPGWAALWQMAYQACTMLTQLHYPVQGIAGTAAASALAHPINQLPLVLGAFISVAAGVFPCGAGGLAAPAAVHGGRRCGGGRGGGHQPRRHHRRGANDFQFFSRVD